VPQLFDTLQIRDVQLRNRIAVSPMCQYSCVDGFATDWHLVHLGSRAVGGAALVFVEATAVLPEARISPQDMGIWTDRHIEPLARIARFVASQGAVPGIQLAHAGRKASTRRPWEGVGLIPESDGGWTTIVAPSAIAFDSTYGQPQPLTGDGIRGVLAAFRAAARRAREAGFQLIEIHSAHGYLLDEFLSPLSNRRTDEYGGTLENRTRIVREVASAVRAEWPERYPLFIRISATDWKEGGWDVNQSIELARQLVPLGVDLVDCSSGGLVPNVHIPLEPGYQVRFAAEIRRQANVKTGAVGLITTAKQADLIIREEQADLIVMARQFLRDPYWPLHAAAELQSPIEWPAQYLRAAPPGTEARAATPPEDFDRDRRRLHAVPKRG
jgi:2,4-dienoyl-CoA reductase-like NADH-dependent reductase (Old Yellow Enzyme family)